ncbi:AtpZ/AtpI family protein [Aurantimonas sp. A2-1-M11]|uniref:AtpZ/AtpI family protein n=1 Tax=Aurantimonas sp. A2-1-M11 TaxID=3113712 RepID=UPI002F950C09
MVADNPKDARPDGSVAHEPRPAVAGGSQDGDWDARSQALAERLAEQRRRMPAMRDEPASRSGGMQGVAQGMKIASEFVAGILVGAGIGYLIDQLAGTTPFGLIVFLMIGFAAGVLNVIRGVSGGTPPHGPDPA